jgi:pimeloyl-ACP methyl ester carboxylesterase
MTTITGYREHDVEARGLRFHVLEWGEAGAPPMVLLHGLTGHAHIWDDTAAALGDRYHIFAPDQRGHGDTQHAPTYSTQDFVDDLEALRRHWGLERFVLMGLSMGGHNGFAYAHQYPDRVSHLIAIDIPPRLRTDRWPNREAMERLAVEGHKPFASFEAAFADARLGNTTAPDENLAHRTRWNLLDDGDGGLLLKWDAKVQVAWKPADLTAALAELRMPVLLVRGGKTLVLPSETAAEMMAALPDGELVEVAASGHSVPTDRPEELVVVVREWLGRRG